jgi:actin-like ATPase involved in cell morphogenesis
MGRTGSERLRKDLKELADEIIEQLETRFANCYPELNHLILG